MLTNKQKKNALVPENLGSATKINLHVNDSTTIVKPSDKVSDKTP